MASSGNRRLKRAYERAHIPLFHLRLGQAHDYMNDYEQTDAEHRAILAALKAREAEKAVKLLRAHLARGASEVLADGAPAANAAGA
jgi:DNA-binding GntR family transcriptional regulator